MEALTGQDAIAALQLYTRLGASGTSFNGGAVARAVRSVAGQRHLSTVINRARVLSTRLRPMRFTRARRARVQQPRAIAAGRSPDDGARPRPGSHTPSQDGR